MFSFTWLSSFISDSETTYFWLHEAGIATIKERILRHVMDENATNMIIEFAIAMHIYTDLIPNIAMPGVIFKSDTSRVDPLMNIMTHLEPPCGSIPISKNAFCLRIVREKLLLCHYFGEFEVESIDVVDGKLRINVDIGQKEGFQVLEHGVFIIMPEMEVAFFGGNPRERFTRMNNVNY